MESEERMQLLGAMHAIQELVAYNLAVTFKLYGLTPEQAFDRIASVSAVVEQGLIEADNGSAEFSDFVEGAAGAFDRVGKAARSYIKLL